MELPSDILLSLLMPSVTNARASEDNFMNEDHWKIGTSSMFLSALGIGPFKDVFWTITDQPGNPYNSSELNPLLMTMVSILSAGPVGIGDGLGMTNETLIMKTCRADGVLLKPSVSATDIDAHFLPNGAPLGNIWTTYSLMNNISWYYTLAVDVTQQYNLYPYSIWPPPSMTPGLVSGYVYFDYFNPSCTIHGNPSSTCLYPFDMNTPLPLQNPSPVNGIHQLSYYVIAPVFTNNWVVLGEVSKFVTISPKRTVDVVQQGNGVIVNIVGSPKEMVTFAFKTPMNTILVINTIIDNNGKATIQVK
jgi:hypothetical protein